MSYYDRISATQDIACCAGCFGCFIFRVFNRHFGFPADWENWGETARMSGGVITDFIKSILKSLVAPVI